MTIPIDTVRILALSIGTLWLGAALTRRIPVLSRYNIPVAVSGGIVTAVVLNLLQAFAGLELVWDLQARDALLLVFFSSIGLSAKLAKLRAGGAMFLRLVLCTVVFLIAQNAVGALGALVVGRPAAYGLIGGSVALAGGHGTAITWGRIAAERGHPELLAHGLAFATFGLIVGGIVGGPLASFLIGRNRLRSERSSQGCEPDDVEGRATSSAQPDSRVGTESSGTRGALVSTRAFLGTLLVFSICVLLGAEMNRWLGAIGFVLPGFVTAMIAGVVLTNLETVLPYELHTPSIELLGDVSLNLFLCMSLVSLELDGLLDALLPISVLLLLQVAFALAFAGWIVFRVCGRDYEAAVLSSGFVGIGLGATPVGMANMNAITSRYGAAPGALLTLPLIGAGVLDLANAFVIDLYVRLLT